MYSSERKTWAMFLSIVTCVIGLLVAPAYGGDGLDLSDYDRKLIYETEFEQPDEHRIVNARKTLIKKGKRVKEPPEGADWVYEGGNSARVKDGKLWMGAEEWMWPPGHPAAVRSARKHSVLWNTRTFPDRFLLEFELMQWTHKIGLNIIFFAATAKEKYTGDSIFSSNLPRRMGDFTSYIKGAINNYHISYLAATKYGDPRGYSRLRKNTDKTRKIKKGKEFLSRTLRSGPHTVRLLKDGNRIVLEENGNVALEWTDKGEVGGPPLGAGFIGLRQMRQSAICTYDNFRVWKIRDDTSPPAVSSVTPEDRRHVRVRFNERIRRKSAKNPEHYSLAEGGSVEKAKVADDGRSVLLTVPKLTRGTRYELTVRNVRDRAGDGNVLKTSSHRFQWRMLEDFSGYEHGDGPDRLARWRTGSALQSAQVDAEKFADQDAGPVLHMKKGENGKRFWNPMLMHDFEQPLTGRWQFSYKYRESNDNYYGTLWLKDTQGEPVFAAGTNNPEWAVFTGPEGHVVDDGEAGTGYGHWVEVTLDVDTERGRARARFHDLARGTTRVYGWFDIGQVEGIAQLGFAAGNYWWVDDVRVVEAGN